MSGLQELFEHQARQTPAATALVLGDEQLTYAQLDARANQLARHLQTLGVGPGDAGGRPPPALPLMVVALLAVLKAGGAYLPLDPDYPAALLAYMLSDSGALVLLTQAQLVAAVPESPATRVCLDTDRPTMAQQPATPLATRTPSLAAGLLHLHVRLHKHAQGHTDPAPRCAESRGLAS